MIALFVALGAAIGAPARYLTDRGVQSLHATRFPWGTMTVNVLACLIYGVVAGAGAALSGAEVGLAATGFCGSLSTFSTFSFETVRLAEQRERLHAVANVLASVRRDAAERLVHAAHEVCPYSNATRNNVDVGLTVA